MDSIVAMLPACIADTWKTFEVSQIACSQFSLVIIFQTDKMSYFAKRERKEKRHFDFTKGKIKFSRTVFTALEYNNS